MFHSGLPHKSINPIELAMAALQHMQVYFARVCTAACDARPVVRILLPVGRAPLTVLCKAGALPVPVSPEDVIPYPFPSPSAS